MIINSHGALKIYVWRALIISGSITRIFPLTLWFVSNAILQLEVLSLYIYCYINVDWKNVLAVKRSHNKDVIHLKIQNHCLEYFSHFYYKTFYWLFPWTCVLSNGTKYNTQYRHIQQSMNRFSRLWVFLLHYIIHHSFGF